MSKPPSETIVVIAIAIIAVGVALAIGFVFLAARIEIAASSSWPLGSLFVNLDRPIGHGACRRKICLGSSSVIGSCRRREPGSRRLASA